ncbi:hypothetical protein [Dermatophilus congolensis]|uniref:Uncharacterized protein n=1 Tax=Dermatophilus congolensis TaxID=1863 RepID=A0A239VDQ2_9MICO|nr:hypothetical protein [Dermatophilus congolensis]MBO3128638.1 hypothetical protein [Dermatophilus congolensis]MBO3132725.1 hypothetical protein [Dermatophilus congolensis]MBO3133112.1 hypothetical protein [Dermatophilus congolensis]MBO3135347.1 hypothetical protein [Dermatophilus congolensis]MBO3137588.1 hypothetical protein [Dermatophilus congolensis]
MSESPDLVTWAVWPASMACLAVTVAAGVGIATGVPALMTLGVGVPMLMMANGWVRLLQLPSPRGTTGILVAAAVILVAGGWVTHRTHVSMLVAAIAVVLVLEFVHQLGRRDRRPRLVESVSSAVFGITVVASGSCFLILEGPVGHAASLGVVAATLVGVAADGLPGVLVSRGRAWVPAVVASLLGAVVGALVWLWVGPQGVGSDVWVAGLAGGLAGLGSFTLRLALCGLPTIAGFRARWAAGAASLLVTGVVAYGQAWVVLGSLVPLLSG